MQSNWIIGGLVIVVVVIVGAMASKNFVNTNEPEPEAPAVKGVAVTLYKSPSCGCCGQYSAYLEGKGYDMDVKLENDMSVIKEQFGVPYGLESCHTMEVEGYVVEGHVPEEAIAKLLVEKPDIKGIGMGGMPSGSPGMPGPKNADFVIYEITKDGEKGEVFMTI